jgi:hypothetical protein
MFSTPPRTLNPLMTDIENLASSCFLKIAALFAKLQRLERMRPPANASSCALAWKLAKAELPRVSPNQIGHSADDKDDEANQSQTPLARNIASTRGRSKLMSRQAESLEAERRLLRRQESLGAQVSGPLFSE